MSTTLEAELLKRTAAGDSAAFNQLVKATRDGVWRLLRALTADDQRAEDALQETFVAVWRSAGSFRSEASARGWIYGVARRQAARTWRRRAGEPAAAVPLHELGAQAGWGRDPEQLVAAIEDVACLHSAMAAMRPADREIIVLCDLEGFTGPEAAAVLEIGVSATRVRLHRARLRLLAILNQRGAHG